MPPPLTSAYGPKRRQSVTRASGGGRRGFFGHDKIEGVATTDGGRTIVVSDDNDFGGITGDKPPFALHAKTLPDGR